MSVKLCLPGTIGTVFRAYLIHPTIKTYLFAIIVPNLALYQLSVQEKLRVGALQRHLIESKRKCSLRGGRISRYLAGQVSSESALGMQPKTDLQAFSKFSTCLFRCPLSPGVSHLALMVFSSKRKEQKLSLSSLSNRQPLLCLPSILPCSLSSTVFLERQTILNEVKGGETTHTSKNLLSRWAKNQIMIFMFYYS